MTNLVINYSPSFDDDLARYLTLESPFKKIQYLDISRNRVTFQGLCHIISSHCIFGDCLEQLRAEGNKIMASLPQIVARMQLPALRYIDLNMNQIDWDEKSAEFKEEYDQPIRVKMQQFSSMSTFRSTKTIQGGWKVIKRLKERRAISDEEEIKVRSVEIAINESLTIKVMCSKDLYID